VKKILKIETKLLKTKHKKLTPPGRMKLAPANGRLYAYPFDLGGKEIY
jgi:hypothetical protein